MKGLHPKIHDIQQEEMRLTFFCIGWRSGFTSSRGMIQDFRIYSIYKCNERPPAQNTRHTTIGNVINMSN